MPDCETCHSTGKIMVGMSYPPGKTIAVHFEYDPCPDCTAGPYTFHAKRTAQIIKDTRNKRIEAEKEDGK